MAAEPVGRPRGASLVELVVALLLTGLVTSATLTLVIAAARGYRRQVVIASMTATLRALATMLPLELALVHPSDTAGSDIVGMAPTAIAFKTMRTVSFLCDTPLLAGARAGSVSVASEPRYGYRLPDSGRDSLFIYAEAEPMDPEDDYWVRADLRGRSAGACPGGAPAMVLELSAVRPPGGLRDVRPGAPLLAYEVLQVAAYADREGVWWVGVRMHGKSRGWSAIQPVLGPLAPGGLRFSYYDALGTEVALPRAVRRIGVVAVASPPGRAGAALRGLRDSLRLDLGLVNSRRP